MNLLHALQDLHQSLTEDPLIGTFSRASYAADRIKILRQPHKMPDIFALKGDRTLSFSSSPKRLASMARWFQGPDTYQLQLDPLGCIGLCVQTDPLRTQVWAHRWGTGPSTPTTMGPAGEQAHAYLQHITGLDPSWTELPLGPYGSQHLRLQAFDLLRHQKPPAIFQYEGWIEQHNGLWVLVDRIQTYTRQVLAYKAV